MILHSIRSKRTTAAAALGAGALLLVGCGSRDLTDTRAQAAGAVAAPVAVSCEPTQRALVRPVVINGAQVSQVECVSTAATGAAPVAYATGVSGAVPVSYVTQAQPVGVYENARVVPAQYPATRTVAPRRVAYQPASERVVRSGRTWKKSAVIIGSSAGIGAGLGAAFGGKKGALIGAAVGGGSAAIWDQVTRKR